MSAWKTLLLLNVVWRVLVDGQTYLNRMIQLHEVISSQFNLSNCWVCTMIPPSVRHKPIIALAVTDPNLFYAILMKETANSTLAEKPWKLVGEKGLLVQGISGKGIGLIFNHSADPEMIDIGITDYYQDPEDVQVVLNGCFNIENQTMCQCLKDCSNCFSETLKRSLKELNVTNECEEDYEFTDLNKYNHSLREIVDSQLKIHHIRVEARVLPASYYYVCGRKAYKWLPVKANGTCVLARLIYTTRVVNTTELQETHKGRRFRRSTEDKVYSITTAQREMERIGKKYSVSLFGEAFKSWTYAPSFTGWGHEMINRLNDYANTTNIMLGHVMEALKEETDELIEIRRQVIANHMGLDILFASQGGLCKVIEQECCTYIVDNSYDIEKHLAAAGELQGKVQDISNHTLDLSEWGGGLLSWLNPLSWFKGIGEVFKTFLIGLLKILGVILGAVLCLYLCFQIVMFACRAMCKVKIKSDKKTSDVPLVFLKGENVRKGNARPIPHL